MTLEPTLELSLDKWNLGVLKSTSTLVSKEEADLIDLIDHIRYGTINDVEIVEGSKVISRSVSVRKLALIDFIRDERSKIDELVVHDGEVSYIHIFGTKPYRHTRKVKF